MIGNKYSILISLAACEWFAWDQAKQGKTKWLQLLPRLGKSRRCRYGGPEETEDGANGKRQGKRRKKIDKLT